MKQVAPRACIVRRIEALAASRCRSWRGAAVAIAISAAFVWWPGCSHSGGDAPPPATPPHPQETTPEPWGSLEIVSDPPGASVYIDGEWQGETPLYLERVPAGTKDIALRKEGWIDYHSTVTVEEGCVLAVNVSLMYPISGRVSSGTQGLEGVTVSFAGGSGPLPAPVTTDSDGAWSAAGFSGTVSVTPSKDGWDFEPLGEQVRGPRIDIDFTPRYRISGRVADGTQGLEGVTVSFAGGSGPLPAPVTTDSDGAWSAAGFSWLITVKAAREGYSFLPAGITVSGPKGDVDFQVASYSIAGRVLRGTEGVSGVTIHFGNGSFTACTDDRGFWHAEGFFGVVTVTPNLEGWTFDPPAIEVSGFRNDVDFLQTSYAVSGQVSTVRGGLGGATIFFREGYAPAVTDWEGRWERSGLAGTTHIVPSREGWTFDPPFVAVDGPGFVSLAARSSLVLNEVLPRNDLLAGSVYLDEDGTKQGWIELYNSGEAPLRLEGYSLSNGRSSAASWEIPDVAIAPRGFLIVWASEKDRRAPDRPLHASFTIMSFKAVVLTQPDGQTIVDILDDIRIPVDRSYGRSPDGGEGWLFYTDPTPGDPNPQTGGKPFAIAERHVSLTAGREYRLSVTSPGDLAWTSSNPLVTVDRTGTIRARSDAMGESSQAVIRAASLDGRYEDSCDVTIVSWVANLSRLELVATPSANQLLAIEDNSIYFARGRDIYASADGMRTGTFLSTFPEESVRRQDVMAVTPFGYFVRRRHRIYKSTDLLNWSVSFTMETSSLYHMLDFDYDHLDQTGYLYSGEYSGETTERHSVYRGIFPARGPETWQRVLTFKSREEWENNRSDLLGAKHIHVVTVDPYTGHLWVGTGDTNPESKILYSDDRGDTFRIVGMGSQSWRTLSIWFTAGYVYWNMDSGRPQSLWRIPRSVFAERGFWPSVTPELSSGTTKVGIRYYVARNETPGYFPVATGYEYTETRKRSLSSGDMVMPFDDPAYDYREKVADLYNGSQWYHAWARDGSGAPLVVMGAAPEGALRDYRGRVFGIKELPDGRCDVQELLSVSSLTPEQYLRYLQLEPRFQDQEEYIYLVGRDTPHGIYKTRLRWVDDPDLQP